MSVNNKTKAHRDRSKYNDKYLLTMSEQTNVKIQVSRNHIKKKKNYLPREQTLASSSVHSYSLPKAPNKQDIVANQARHKRKKHDRKSALSIDNATKNALQAQEA